MPRTNSMPPYLLFSTCILFVRQKNFFLYLVVVDERSSSNDCNHSGSPPSKRYRKQCKEVQQKSVMQSSPTDGNESTSRCGVRRSDLGLLTFSDSSPNIASNIHSRDHRMGKLNKLIWTHLSCLHQTEDGQSCMCGDIAFQLHKYSWKTEGYCKLIFSLHLRFCFVWFFHNVFVIMCALNIHRYV